jgi:hypothetical protein
MSATIEKKERSYAKKKHKTDPIGIRFNIKQISIALAKSGKSTKQELVDWLIDRYLNEENIELTVARHTQQMEASKYQQPYSLTTQNAAPKQIKRSYDWYSNARKECQTQEDWNELKEMIAADEFLTDNQKFNLIKKPVQ